jgi:hypothetical protein
MTPFSRACLPAIASSGETVGSLGQKVFVCLWLIYLFILTNAKLIIVSDQQEGPPVARMRIAALHMQNSSS